MQATDALDDQPIAANNIKQGYGMGNKQSSSWLVLQQAVMHAVCTTLLQKCAKQCTF